MCSPREGGGLCCKVDELINYVIQSDMYKNLKFVLVGDDDYFYRVDRILLWLSYIDHANISHVPLLANGFTSM